MGKYKYLFKNVGLLTISNFGTKLLSFFLVPLYTSILTTTEYGTYDIMYTTVSLMIPILTVNIIDATMRFAIDKNSDRQEIFSICVKIILKGILIFGVLVALNTIFGVVAIINDYLLFFIAMFIMNMVFQLLQSFSRGIDKVFDLAVSGIINSVVMLLLNVYLLVFCHMGLAGYFIANISAHVVAAIYLMMRIRVHKYIRFKNLSKKCEKELTDYSKPLVINRISWWINNASDRYIVTWLCGMAANGVYSVGYKIPSILSVIQTIFNQAWTLSSVTAYDSDDSDGFFKNVYNLYNFVMVAACSVMIVLTRVTAHWLYAKDFFEAWRYVPFLMIAIVFGALSGVLDGVFQAVKDSKMQSLSTTIGAVANITMNIAFVYLWGPIGAAIATAISYWLVWFIRLHHVKKYMKIKIKLIRDYSAYILLVIQTALMLLFNDSILLYITQGVLCLAIIALYCKECVGVIFRCSGKLIKNKNNK